MSTDGQYTRRFSHRYPGLFIILLDQSLSMNEPIVGQKYTKAEIATTALNTIVWEMINAAGFDEEGVRRKYTSLSILGYNKTVYSLLPSTDDLIDIPTLADNPLVVGTLVRQVEIAPGKFRQIQEKRPIWIKPQVGEGIPEGTQMANAFVRAKDIALRWVNTSPEPNQAERKKCFPPIIINITDGKYSSESNPIEVSQQIRAYGTEEGKILIFNCHFTQTLAQPMVFPGDIKDIENLDEHGLAKTMFLMSSIIPQSLRNAPLLPEQQYLHPQARCFVYNADPDILIKFLRWGTQKRHHDSEGRIYGKRGL